jgi:hypothetical protein
MWGQDFYKQQTCMSPRTRTIICPIVFLDLVLFLYFEICCFFFHLLKKPDVTAAIYACHFAHFSYLIYLIILIVISPTKCCRGSNILLHHDLIPQGLMMDIVLLTLYCICTKMCVLYETMHRGTNDIVVVSEKGRRQDVDGKVVFLLIYYLFN